MARHTILRHAGTAMLVAAVSLALFAFPAKSWGGGIPVGSSCSGRVRQALGSLLMVVLVCLVALPSLAPAEAVPRPAPANGPAAPGDEYSAAGFNFPGMDAGRHRAGQPLHLQAGSVHAMRDNTACNTYQRADSDHHVHAVSHCDAYPYRDANTHPYTDDYCALDGDANANVDGDLNLDRNAHTNADGNANRHGDIDASRAPSLPAADSEAVAASSALPAARPAASSSVSLLKFGTSLG